jgi:hypothetical protein
MTDTAITEARRRLRDQLLLTGPDHYDLAELFTHNGDVVYGLPPTPTGQWTACLVGHSMLANPHGPWVCNLLPDFDVKAAIEGVDLRWTWSGTIDELDRWIKDADNEVAP